MEGYFYFFWLAIAYKIKSALLTMAYLPVFLRTDPSQYIYPRHAEHSKLSILCHIRSMMGLS